jgi:hypothetical protein
MKTTRVALVSSLALALAVPAIAATATDEEKIVSREEVQRAVTVRDLTVVDGAASGVVVNRSNNPVKDIRLAIRYEWLWNNEMRPGKDDPGRTEFYTIPEAIPPGGSVRFTYRPSAPLPQRSDGKFMTIVAPVEFVEIVQAPGTPTGATSGAGQGTTYGAPSRPAEPAPGGIYEPAPRAPSQPPPSATQGAPSGGGTPPVPY